MLTFVLGFVVGLIFISGVNLETRSKIINYFDLSSKFRSK